MRILAIYLAISAALAQEGYRKPSQAILDVLNAPLTPTAIISPTGDALLLVQMIRNPPIADLARPMLRLAGNRIDPAANSPHLTQYAVSLSAVRIADGVETRIATPPGAKIANPRWSPDGKQLAFLNYATGEIFVADPAAGTSRKLIGGVNSAYGKVFSWLPNSRSLLVQIIPAGRGKPPEKPAVPSGPNTQESTGKAAPVRTYQDLLASPHDERLFEHYAAAQLALVDAGTGRVTPVGSPAIFTEAAPSPDGNLILVERVGRPFSWLYPASSFPREIEVWDRKGALALKVASLPLAEAPIEGVATGPRRVEWKPSEPSTLVWIEALDEGNPRKSVPHRDRIMSRKVPAETAPVEIARIEHRVTGVEWLETGSAAIVTDSDPKRRWRRTLLVKPGEPHKVLASRNAGDRYTDMGTPLQRVLANGHSAIRQQGEAIFMEGTGASPEGDRPFLDRLDLATGKTERMFRSSPDSYESVLGLAAGGSGIVTRYESASEPPNYVLRTGAARKALTRYPNPAPQLQKIRKQLVKYQRADGVELSFTLYLPPEYREGARLPAVVWAYPREYTDAEVAGQVSGSAARFFLPPGASHLYFLLAGYAILDNAAMPVVGDPETVNNTYLDQIVAGAKAAIDKAVQMGVADRNRIGVGGHSYGGFMTANLLAHSDLFRAGIARSGAHNRTLTPFGFQSERRTLWEAQEVYLKMSPLLNANRINEPILFIHGEADNNQGTFPIQSDRMYQAVRGNGGVTRLVMLPHEAHGYAARESIEHVVAEMISWFDRHVKDAPPR